ncbi:DHA2 family methylenomycin A resistance protein-like MFS transporter [Kitasatospora sp. MAA4]|uniref:MFS transporter n=1 Tax=Kitasatospora sp. MAA4 TaxID=3035093 RepID=UPI002472F779|nr:MFS transporter [Kitasatospora sp. MAA4]MDH6137896.1 DHA2 family methylenomycin A resistance protein-like MFS transporter [Kitasatospora sp. MAA4]
MTERTLDRPGRRTAQQRRVLAATGVSYVIVLLDTSIVNVALNAVGGSLAIGIGGLQWVVDAYTLAFAAFLLTGGTLGDRWGVRRTYLAGLLVFTAASAGCGLAGALPVLIAARVGQGLGAALLVPAALALINHAHPQPAQRARAVGVWMALGGAAMAAGPLVGGGLVAAFGWRSVFFVNVPIGLAGLVLARRVGDPPPAPVRRRVDLVGLGSGVLALAAPMGVLIEGRRLGWTSPPVLAGVALGAAAITLFLLAQSRSTHPMLPLSLFRNRLFAASTYASATSAFVFYGLLFVTSLYFQQVRGCSPLLAGAALLPMTVAVALGGYCSDRIARLLGARRSMGAAFFGYAAGAGALLAFGPRSPYPMALGPLVIIGLACGFISPAATAPALATVTRDRSAIAAAALNCARQSGSTAGVAVFGTLVATLRPFVDGLRAALLVTAAASVIAALVWLLALPGTAGPAPVPAGAASPTGSVR